MVRGEDEPEAERQRQFALAGFQRDPLRQLLLVLLQQGGALMDQRADIDSRTAPQRT